MRPRKLSIDGFTCYADPVEIDFSNLDVFVICGPTGAGKSTIIDAMCYALYGKIPRQSEIGQPHALHRLGKIEQEGYSLNSIRDEIFVSVRPNPSSKLPGDMGI